MTFYVHIYTWGLYIFWINFWCTVDIPARVFVTRPPEITVVEGLVRTATGGSNRYV